MPEEFQRELIEEDEDLDAVTDEKKPDEYHKKKFEVFTRGDLVESAEKSGEQQSEENGKEKGKESNEQTDSSLDIEPARKKLRLDTTSAKDVKKSLKDVDQEANGLPQVLQTSRWESLYEKLAFPVIDGIPLTPAILDRVLPEGYEVLAVPEDYQPLNEQPPDWTELPKNNEGYLIPQESTLGQEYLVLNPTTDVPADLQFLKDHDVKHFQTTLIEVPENELSSEEKQKRKLVQLILKVKNGNPQGRKQAMRQLVSGSLKFGSKMFFDQVLPLLKEPTLDDQERHLIVKMIGRVMFQLNDKIRPDTKRILTVIAPLLIDPDYFSRMESREIISSLSKAAGLSHMIATLRPDLDSSDEYIRNITSRVFAVMAGTLGIPAVLPFLKAVCRSNKSWRAKHTGIKTVQQIAVLVGSSVLPQLNGLVDCVAFGLDDEQSSVRTISAMAISALAEASAPFGIESFDKILDPLWRGIKLHRGKSLAAYLKAMGYLIPLMEPEIASHYSKEVFHVLIREFRSPDDEMKKTCLKIIQQCCATEGVSKSFLIERVLDPFFDNFWTRRVAMDRKTNQILVETTYQLSVRCGVSEIVDKILKNLKDDNEIFRKMTVEAIDKIANKLGTADLSERSVDLILDGLVLAYQEQTSQDPVFLHGFGTVINSLGLRVKPHLPAIVSVILYRLKHKAPETRELAADLISLICPVMKQCEEEDMILRLSTIVYESLGEVYPDVLGSLLNAMKSIIAVVGVEAMNPPINQILPTLTPILRNRHEKVQEATIQLIGIIADAGPEFVNAREWMRICFELLEMLKSPRKSIRKSANQTFGYLAKAIGPQDVLATLLDNLKVQERQLRVCTAVAIAIVAETCQPFTVLPALMNEYRTPDKNVQNGVLKTMTFLFEYLGDNIEQEYIYSLVPLLEDALTDRDLVHRQTAATVVKHMSLGCIGNGLEDVFFHFLNLIFPNIFETSPHVIQRILESLDGIRNNVGNGIILNYVLAGLFHPARKVRVAYWKLYNNMYVQNCDSIVPYYPDFDDSRLEVEAKVEELDIWV